MTNPVIRARDNATPALGRARDGLQSFLRQPTLASNTSLASQVTAIWRKRWPQAWASCARWPRKGAQHGLQRARVGIAACGDSLAQDVTAMPLTCGEYDIGRYAGRAVWPPDKIATRLHGTARQEGAMPSCWMRRKDGRTIHVRKSTQAEPVQMAICQALQISPASGGVKKLIV